MDKQRLVIEGIAATVEFVHPKENERLSLEAFTASLAKRPEPAMYWKHEQGKPIGQWLKLSCTPVGLHVVGEIDLTIEDGQRAAIEIMTNRAKGLSLGYSPMRGWRRAGVSVVTDMDMFEISVCPSPLDPLAVLAWSIVGENGMVLAAPHDVEQTI